MKTHERAKIGEMTSEIRILKSWQSLPEESEANIFDVQLRHPHNILSVNLVCYFLFGCLCLVDSFGCGDDAVAGHDFESFIDLFDICVVWRRCGFVLDVQDGWHLVQVIKDTHKFLSFEHFLDAFLQKLCALLCHYRIVTLIGHSWRHFINDLDYTTPSRESSATDRLPDSKNTIKRNLGVDGFHTWSKMVELVKQLELFLFDV